MRCRQRPARGIVQVLGEADPEDKAHVFGQRHPSQRCDDGRRWPAAASAVSFPRIRPWLAMFPPSMIWLKTISS